MQADNQAVMVEKTDFLKAVTLIGDQPVSVLTALAQVLTPREFPPSTVIIAQGDEIEDLYLIVSGSVKLVK